MHFRPTEAVIDLEAVRRNVRALAPERAAVMAVVKANGYGHGDVAVARAALSAGASWLGVALVEEGIRLREAGVEAPILVLSEFPRGSEKEALAARLSPTLYTREGLRSVAGAASALEAPARAHLKLDTGMRRVGLPPAEAEEFVREMLRAGVGFEALWTHFAKADEPDDPSMARQLDEFLRASQRLSSARLRPLYLHAANSAATMRSPATHLGLVRLGIAMYGLAPGPGLPGTDGLRAAMSWRSSVSFVKRVGAGQGISYGLRYRLQRESTVATVPVGYADGYSRLLGDRGVVLIRGRRHPVAGTVTMDQLMVDCGDDAVQPGDEVVLLGSQGGERLTADELAGWMGTINYEVVCRVSERVPRRYVHGAQEEPSP